MIWAAEKLKVSVSLKSSLSDIIDYSFISAMSYAILDAKEERVDEIWKELTVGGDWSIAIKECILLV